ncbi:MAG: type II secretion system GspH family protein [Planctomycetes bacterium]|nr:type II secretion system GspH family protein [Planctomycetota bacterium]
MKPTASARRAFTLIELLVVISIIAVLAGMLLPALGSVRTAARASRCQGAIRQMTLATEAYASDNEGLWSAVYSGGSVPWLLSLAPYLAPEKNYVSTGQAEVSLLKDTGLRCPGFVASKAGLPAPDYDAGFFGRNRQLKDTATTNNYGRPFNPLVLSRRSDACLYIENANAVAGVGMEAGGDRIWCVRSTGYRHRNRVSVAYADGHVGSVDALTLTASPNDPFWAGR